MLEFYLGGARSGKSRLAEQAALASGKKLYYIATGSAGDEEMQARIEKHQAGRDPKHWTTIEEGISLATVLNELSDPNHCLVVDCLTLWLSNCLLDSDGCWQRERESLLDSLEHLKGYIIFVSNEVGQGIVPLGKINRRFVDESGFLHQELAARCDRMIFAVAGLPQVLKGDV